ncbi:type VII secretion integral membrane protein EccD [Corynebacterium sp. sy039]|uniref:type VII secretion integral membrane protein EccD n=1 Tax=Corynebacterium sp. sy039 TaxID=2599641 RepID=UPI0011B49019|nr:type VII secretion integral membrane protein EccD [Corynebacterium sp. sy039]QDZ42056.1 type VII secretion integral membrane protein EccD [Corynebacterium sp. sy039]
MISADHYLRAHIRFNLGTDIEAIRKGHDCALPASSSLAEALPEILRLCDALESSTQWQAHTASGKPIDLFTPLVHTGLEHGAIIVLSPQEQYFSPISKDAAEALADYAQTISTAHLQHTLVTALYGGFLAFALFVFLLPIPIAPFSRLLAVGLCGLSLCSWKHTSSLLTFSCLSTAIGVFSILIQEKIFLISAPHAGLAVLLASLSALLCIGIAIVAGKIHITHAAAVASFFFLMAGSSPAAFLVLSPFDAAPHALPWLRNICALGLGNALITTMYTPNIAMLVAKIRIPRLPSAGQDLSLSDEENTIDDANNCANAIDNAHALVAGITIGTSVFICICALSLSFYADSFSQALTTTLGLALLLHAHRFISAITTWAMWLSGLSCLLSSIHATQFENPISMVAAIIPVLVIICFSLYSLRSKQRDLYFQPTTIVWLERCESLSIAACLPLCAHLAGVFSFIRSLG